MSKYIVPFSSSDVTLARAGGKGVNLVELVRAGFAVPTGFIISTEAYRAFVEVNQLQSRILTLASYLSADDLSALEHTSNEISALFEQGVMPADIAIEINSAYNALDKPQAAVAVRSSATAEDLPGLAFAGQQDTYLNIMGEEAVLKAVKQCWGSLWTARAIAYRTRNHILPKDVALAVVIQTMVASESSGVVFTANPLTGRRDEMVIDASFGLGEAIVSGQVEPDHYAVNSQTWMITERKLGAKAMAIIPRSGGGTEHTRRDDSAKQSLPDEQIIQLAQMAQQVAAHFGSPQDIEWAWANQQLYLLQSRPITSLYPLPQTDRMNKETRIYVNFNAIQGVSDPLTPLGIDALRLLFGGVTKMLRIQSPMQELLPETGGRLFLDFTSIMSDSRLRKLGLSLLADTEPGARHTLLRLIEEGRIPTRQILTPGGMAKLFLALLPILRRVVVALIRPDQVRPQAIADAEQYMREVQQHIQKANSLAQCLQVMEDDLPNANRISIKIMASAVPVLSAALPLVGNWLSDWLGEPPGVALQLMRGLPGNVTMEMNLKLWAAAQRIRADADALTMIRAQPVETLVEAYRQHQLPITVQQTLDAFLQEYGMRGMAEIDLGHPRWRDDPTPIMHTLLSYLELEDLLFAPDVVFQRGAEQAEQLAHDYVERARQLPFGRLRAWLLRATIHRMRTLGGLRELPLSYIARLYGLYRTALLGYGQELVKQGALECADDIFFVPLEILKRAAGGDIAALKSTISVNRAAFEREQMRKQMPRVLLSTGEAYYEGIGEVTDSEHDLTGDAVSSGVVEGIARVIFDPHGARVEPGEILVCPSTDPGWTPLFLTAGGLVMEIGGMMTHGSIVAREYGIPAVVGVHQATTRLKTGQRLRVDGNRGHVTVMN
ncbi:MAG: PEP/pyruvate-binding domain-containing protein [Chloroflexota bacterium]